MVACGLEVGQALRRRAWGMAAFPLWAALAGCGVTLQAEHVRIDEANSLDPPGVYYALPRTALHVSWSARLSQEHGGGFDDFEGCQSSCRAKPETLQPDACKPQKPAPWVAELLGASVVGVARPDPAHVYRVSASAGNRFATVNHKLQLNDFGTLAALEASATEGVSELVSNIASAALRALPSGRSDAAPLPASAALDKDFFAITLDPSGSASRGGAEAALQQKKPDAEKPGQSPCEKAAGVPASTDREFDLRTALRLTKKAMASGVGLNCQQVACIDFVLDRLAKLIQELEGLQLAAAMRAPSAAQAKIAVELLSRQIRDATSARAALQQGLSLQAPSPPALVVAHWRGGNDFPQLKHSGKSRQLAHWSVESGTGPLVECRAQDGTTAGEPIGALCETLIRQLLVVKAADAPLSKAAKQQPNALAPTGQGSNAGYRYRIPALAEVRIHQDRETGPVLARQLLPIAQFGPVVALPARYTGRQAALNFELNDQGALRSIQIGQEAQTGAAVGTLADAIEERRSRRAERAEAARSAPLQDAQRSNELQAEAIRAQQLQRCAEALRNLPPDAPMPPICP